MNIEEYSSLAYRTASHFDTINMNVLHGAVGAGGEAGEILDIAKKTVFYGKQLDEAHMLEEIGDVMWYLNLIVVSLGTTWDKVLSANIAKLEARYPGLRFSAENALNRDLDAERAALEAKLDGAPTATVEVVGS